ncbi:ROK family transcriptional regulator [uncultured Muribaculum sp.]|uniref:ROK family transcriptional regulator n=1 Tax=uncultured Muribaculum sp. TaxID=1918613 RepID=UPI0025EA133E|nr:ROK family transcriptional regulator [uncultured Muribaculum sp.]
MTLPFISELEKGSKNALVKKAIIKYYINNVTSTIPELSKEMNLSIPTVTRIINEMCEEGFITYHGKIDSKGGRRPSVYGLAPASGYFLGVEIKRQHINIGLANFIGEIIAREFHIPYDSTKEPQHILDEICEQINEFVDGCEIPRHNVLNACVAISGRVNPASGYSFSSFNFSETPVSEMMSERIGIPVGIDNDTRAMTYGEQMRGCINGEKDFLYINLSWGLGLGIVINGSVYGGKSGFAGELGHVNTFDNEEMCHCGKKGCLETEVSGMALHRELLREVRAGKSSILSARMADEPENVSLSDIVDAVNSDDSLCIELVEEIGHKLGKQVAALINLFNPELVVIGGIIAGVQEYLLQPVRQGVRKYSLSLVNRDSRIVCSRLGEKSAVIGACLLARNKLLEQV